MSTDKLTASTSLMFDNLPKLLGQSNYVLWSNAWRIAFKACQWWNSINGEIVRPISSTDLKEKDIAEDSSTTGTAPTSQITEEEWDIVNNQAHPMLNTGVDHTTKLTPMPGKS